MKRYLLLFLLIGLFTQSVIAQRGQRGQRKQQLEELRKQFIEEKLGISGSDADAFWEVYNKYDAERTAVRKEMRRLKAGFNALSDTELATAIERYFQLKEQEIAIDKKYFQELKNVLTIRQISVLYQAEQKFKQEVLKRIRERMKNGGGGNGGFDD